MDRREYTSKLIEFGRGLQPASSGTARARYLTQLVAFGNALAARAREDPSTVSEGVSGDQIATFQSLIGANPQHILWRVAGATLARRRTLSAASARALGALGGTHDLLGPLGSEYHEPSYSRVLAFLMCPRRATAVGGACQRAFLQLLSDAEAVEQASSLAEQGPFSVEAEHVGTWGRVDVCMESESTVVWVETKVSAAEGQSQLLRYAKGLRAVTSQPPRIPVLAFLTVHREQRPSPVKLPVIHITFRQVLRAWMTVSTQFSEQEGTYLRAYLKSVAMHLYGLAAPGPFENWPLAVQRKALDFVDKGVELQ